VVSADFERRPERARLDPGGSLVEMRVKWQERKEWKALEFASSHPQPMLEWPIPQNNVAAVGTVAKRGGSRPVSRR